MIPFAVMCGCSADSEQNELPFQKQLLQLQGCVQSSLTNSRVTASGFETGDQVGVYVSSTGSLAQSGNLNDNVAYTYANGNLTAPVGQEVYWEKESTQLNIYAYYPYSAGLSSVSAFPFTVKSDQSSADNFYNSDIITAQEKNVVAQEEAVMLSFDHVLSKINIKLIAGEGITTNELASADKTFSIKGLVTNGEINLEDGTAQAGTNKSTISPYTDDGLNYMAIVYPQEGTLSLMLELDNEIYTYSTNVSYQPKYQYTYSLIVTTWESPQMILSAVELTPWEDGESESGEMIKYKDDTPIISNLSNEAKALLANYDINKDGEISEAEAESVKRLSISDTGESALSVLRYCKNMEALTLYNLTSDVMSLNLQLPKLQNLSITSCRGLYILTISDCVDLRTVSIELAGITSLNVSKNTNLTSIYLGTTSVTELDVSANAKLSKLSVNPSLSTLYLANGQTIETLDIPESTEIEYK